MLLGPRRGRHPAVSRCPTKIAIVHAAQTSPKETRRSTTPAAQADVARIGRRLAARCCWPRYPYRFSVATTARIPNRLCAAPGGPVCVNRWGSIQAAGPDPPLAVPRARRIVLPLQPACRAQRWSNAMGRTWASDFLGSLLVNAGGATCPAGGALRRQRCVPEFSLRQTHTTANADRSAPGRPSWGARRLGSARDDRADGVLIRAAEQRESGARWRPSSPTHPSPKIGIRACATCSAHRRTGTP